MAEWGRWQSPKIQRKYPHLLAVDAYVWSAYLRREGGKIARVQYDVWVGTPVDYPAESTADERLIGGTSRKRIDVVYEDHERRVHLVEVKPYGNYVAYGQVIMYRDLLIQAHPALGLIKLHICCADVDPDIRGLAEAQGISVDLVDIADALGGLG